MLKTESNDSGVTHPDSVTSSGFSSYRKINNQIPAPTTNYFSVMQKNKQNTDYIGFGHLPNQIFAKLIKKGFDFNVMIVGESGLGKSTLVNSLFLSDIYNSSFPGPSFRMEQTVKVETHEVLLEEKGVKLRLGVIDTPGFGDHVDNSESWEPIEEYIENQYSRYLAAESRLKRKPHFKDSRVHCCLYFVPPRVHGLRQIDLTFMKRLHEQVVIVPVIAKSDSLTPEERKTMKARIRNQLEEAQIHVYYFPDCQETPLALDTSEYTSETKFSVDISHQPFNVIGSNFVMDGRLRARKYPWGIVDIENEEHSDLKMLRQCLMQTNMYNLIDTTNTIFYERYRRSRLEKRFENVEADVHATAYSPGKMAALRDNNPLAYINQETEDYRKNRDEMFNQEIEKEIMEKFQVYDDDLERKRQQIEKYREEEELSLIEQYELLQQRREALEAKKEQAEKRWNKQRHQSEDNSKNFESKPFEGNKNGINNNHITTSESIQINQSAATYEEQKLPYTKDNRNRTRVEEAAARFEQQ